MTQNWKSQTLENLEKNKWPSINADEESHLITTCHALRKKPLIDFSIEDLRIMIGQDIGLKYLIPIAIEILNETILAEGHYYEGDLLSAVLTSNIQFWRDNIILHKNILELFNQNGSILKGMDIDWQIKKKLVAEFADFEMICHDN